jgi:hypothetical protein
MVASPFSELPAGYSLVRMTLSLPSYHLVLVDATGFARTTVGYRQVTVVEGQDVTCLCEQGVVKGNLMGQTEERKCLWMSEQTSG